MSRGAIAVYTSHTDHILDFRLITEAFGLDVRGPFAALVYTMDGGLT